MIFVLRRFKIFHCNRYSKLLIATWENIFYVSLRFWYIVNNLPLCNKFGVFGVPFSFLRILLRCVFLGNTHVFCFLCFVFIYVMGFINIHVAQNLPTVFYWKKLIVQIICIELNKLQKCAMCIVTLIFFYVRTHLTQNGFFFGNSV